MVFSQNRHAITIFFSRQDAYKPQEKMYDITAMLNMFPKLSVVIASTALSVAVIAASQVHASTISYDFTVKVTQGSLAGKLFSGVFNYDDSTLKGIGSEELGVAEGLTVCMNFLGRNYKETDDSSYPAFPKLVFEDGKIKRLDFWIEPGKRIVWWTLPGWKVDFSLRKASCGAVTACKKTAQHPALFAIQKSHVAK